MKVGEYACWTCMIICFIVAIAYNNFIVGAGSVLFAALLVFYYKPINDAKQKGDEQ